MSDSLNSERLRKRVLSYIDPRGRPSEPGRQVTEPAFPVLWNGRIVHRDPEDDSGFFLFEHWKLDGEPSRKLDGDGGGKELASKGAREPQPLPPSPSNFSAKTMFDPFVFEVLDGQFFVYEPDGTGTSEPLDEAIPKLAAILGAARLAANSS